MPPPPPAARRLSLLTGPAGSGKTHRVLERVREAATAEGPRGRGAAGTAEALLVLPTYAQVNHARRAALSRWDARGILDAPFTTFTGAGERFLPTFRVRSLPSAEERDRLMEEALRRAAVPAFARVADRGGFRERLLRLLKEAKQTGLARADLAARLAAGARALAVGSRERLEGFLAVAEAYEALLARAGLEDHEDALRRLLEAVRGGPPGPLPRVLAVDGFDDFTAVEEAILVALAEAVVARGGEAVVTLPFDPARPGLFPGAASVRDHLLARGFREERLAGFPRSASPALAAIAAGLFGPRRDPVPGGEDVCRVVAADPEDEADAVAREARRLVAPGGPARGWRDVLVVVRSLAEAGPRLEAALERLGVPVRVVGAGRPLGAEALCRALRGPLRVLGGGVEAGEFDPPEVVAWLRWVATARGDAALAAATDVAEVRWRERGWPADWAAFRRAAGGPLAVPIALLEGHRLALAAARGAAAVHAGLLRALPDLAPLPPLAGLSAEGRPLDPAHDRRAARAGLARARLADLVQGMDSAARRTGLGTDVAAAEAVAAAREAIDRATFAVPDPRLDAVSVVDAEEARHWEAPAVVVAGLAEGEFPRRPREDPLLDDEAREDLRRGDAALGLPLARDREARERRLLYGALTRARRRLVLVRSAYAADGAPREPSLLLRDLARVVEAPEPVARRPGRAAPDLAECSTRRDLALFAASRRRRAGAADERPLAEALLRRLDPDLLRRAARWVRPAADALPAAAAERFRASVDRVSASALNDALACRHRHFLARVARVPRDDVPFEGPALDALARGRLLHDALRRAVEAPDLPAAEVARATLEGEALSDLERDLLALEVERVVALWRAREAQTAGPFRPLAGTLEWEFGPRAGRPVELGSGEEAVRLEGFVDRVDAAGDAALVVDYKTSPTGAKEAWEAAVEGTDLQLPLYAAAVEALLGHRVVGLEWPAITRRERRGIWAPPGAIDLSFRAEGGAPATPPDLAEVRRRAEATAREVVRDVRRGRHGKQREDAATCEGCDWRAVCRPDLGGLRARGEGDAP